MEGGGQGRSSAADRVDFSKSVEVGATRWLRLETLEYLDDEGKPRKWDRAVRTTKQSEESTDACVILAILKLEDREEVVLVRQFRPPVAAYTIELPAGLIDKGETVEEAAIRELREECGLVGKAVRTSPSLVMSPGLTNESIAIVTVEVDMQDPANQNPKQQLDEGEFVQMLCVDRRKLLDDLVQRRESGDKVFSALWTLAQGMALAP
jgi:8-oxo-dGTP pyrophosphatase MutT (NUDIX family)